MFKAITSLHQRGHQLLNLFKKSCNLYIFQMTLHSKHQMWLCNIHCLNSCSYFLVPQKPSRSLSRKKFRSGCSCHVYSEFHHCSRISQAASLLSGTTFTPTSRGELALLWLCQVQVSVYSLSLFCCADSRGGEREPSFLLPRLCLHRQRGQSHNLISSSANNVERSETALMSEHIRTKRETADENTRRESVRK